MDHASFVRRNIFYYANLRSFFLPSLAGRTARGASGKGRALLFLLPEELGFLKYLRAAKVTMNEYEFPDKKVAQVQVRR